jgi:hypothetical protein
MKKRRMKQPDYAAILHHVATRDLKAIHRKMRKEPVGKHKLTGDDMFHLGFLSCHDFMKDVLDNSLKEAARLIRRARRVRDSKS